jgi:hypothetical protein
MRRIGSWLPSSVLIDAMASLNLCLLPTSVRFSTEYNQFRKASQFPANYPQRKASRRVMDLTQDTSFEGRGDVIKDRVAKCHCYFTRNSGCRTTQAALERASGLYSHPAEGKHKPAGILGRGLLSFAREFLECGQAGRRGPSHSRCDQRQPEPAARRGPSRN